MGDSSVSNQTTLPRELKLARSSKSVSHEKESLTIAAIAMPSSQPNTLRMYTRTYKRRKTKTKGTIDIVHITPFTVGAWLSGGRDAPPLDDILSIHQCCADSPGYTRRFKDPTSPDVDTPRIISSAWALSTGCHISETKTSRQYEIRQGRSLKKLIIVTASGTHTSQVDLKAMRSVNLGRLPGMNKYAIVH